MKSSNSPQPNGQTPSQTTQNSQASYPPVPPNYQPEQPTSYIQPSSYPEPHLAQPAAVQPQVPAVQQVAIPAQPLQQAPVQAQPYQNAQSQAAPQVTSYQHAQAQPQIPLQQEPTSQVSYLPQMQAQPLPQMPEQALRQPRSFESVVGKNILGVVAAALTFLGLIFLGFLVVPAITDTIKVGFMFTLSVALTAVGAPLSLKKKNAFTVALLACGCGSLFITLMLSHTFFQIMPDYLAYGLLLFWLAGFLALSKLCDSRLLVVLVYAGMIISLCFAYLLGLSEDRIPLLVGYHVLSVAIIVAGSRFYSKDTYAAGLCCSLILSCVAICVVFGYYLSVGSLATSVQLSTALGTFAIQVIGAIGLSYLLYKHARAHHDSSIRIVLQSFNKAMLLFVFFIALYLAPGFIISTSPLVQMPIIDGLPYPALTTMTIIACLAALFHVCIDAVLERSRTADDEGKFSLESISVFSMSIFASLLLMFNYRMNQFAGTDTMLLPGLILVSLALTLAARATGNTKYTFFAAGALGLDLLLMFVGGYASLVTYGTIASALAYLVVLCALIFLLWRALPEDRRAGLQDAFVITLILVFELSILSIFYEAGISGIATSIVVMASALVCVIAGFALRQRTLRLSGLIMVMICVLKLVTIDIGDAEATMRVIALIAGGLICFGISALYNYSVKRFDEETKS